MTKTQKHNVAEFNSDVTENSGYRYTTNAPYSSIVANERITRAVLASIPKSASKIVDVGCGDGSYSALIAAAFPKAAVVGFDPAATAIEVAKAKHPAVDFNVGDILNLSSFPNQFFEIAVVRGVIHHLPDPAGGIANAAKLGDRIIVVEPNGNNPILKYIEKHSQYHIDHEEQSFSSKQLVAWCNATGYQVTKLDYIGFVPYFFPTIPARVIHFFQPWLEKIGWLKKYFAAQIVITYQRMGH